MSDWPPDAQPRLTYSVLRRRNFRHIIQINLLRTDSADSLLAAMQSVVENTYLSQIVRDVDYRWDGIRTLAFQTDDQVALFFLFQP